MAQDIAAMQARAGCRVSIDHDGLIHVVSDEAVVSYATGVPVSPYGLRPQASTPTAREVDDARTEDGAGPVSNWSDGESRGHHRRVGVND